MIDPLDKEGRMVAVTGLRGLCVGTGIAMTPEVPQIRHESEKPRWDRNFGDRPQELGVAQTGIQILFAFLLTLPFSSASS